MLHGIPLGAAPCWQYAAVWKVSLFWLIEHTELFFPVLLVGLVLTVEAGSHLRNLSPSINTVHLSIRM
jgi:hypothetical protein